MHIRNGDLFNFSDQFHSDVASYNNEVMQATEDFDMLEAMKKFLADNPDGYEDASIDSFLTYLCDNDLVSFNMDYMELGFFRMLEKAKKEQVMKRLEQEHVAASAPRLEEAEASTKRQWQPIETAPKNGVYILGYDPAWKHVAIPMVWSRNREEWAPFIENIVMNPTHWMSLELPKEAGE